MEREYQVYTRRRSTGISYQYYRRRTELERQERATTNGLQQLGHGLVYSSVMGLPAPTAEPRPGIPIMRELPRRVNGMHPNALFPVLAFSVTGSPPFASSYAFML
jgi:hypothetical protein